jgi:cytochrome oxidase Cu insertion factor (SCO1/SenC/PrrC family)
MHRDRGEAFSSRRLARTLCLAGALTLALVCGAASDAFAQVSQHSARRQEASTPAAGHEQHAASHEQHTAPQRLVETASPEALIKLNRIAVSVPDIEALNQEGRRVRFHTDLIKNRVVVVSFIYTSCTDTCTSQGKQLATLQRALGASLGRDVYFVVVSTDPATDTPAKLKKWSETFGAKEGWTLITGERAPLESLWKSFPGVRTGRDAHEAIIFIGNDARGLWVRADGLRPADELLSLIDTVSGSITPGLRAARWRLPSSSPTAMRMPSRSRHYRSP